MDFVSRLSRLHGLLCILVHGPNRPSSQCGVEAADRYSGEAPPCGHVTLGSFATCRSDAPQMVRYLYLCSFHSIVCCCYSCGCCLV